MVILMKSIKLSTADEQRVRIHATLGNPARMQILGILSRNPASIIADIVKELPLAQSTISQHIAVLMEAGLIYGEDIEGGRRCCRINTEVLRSFSQDVVGWAYDLATSSGCHVEAGDAS